MPKLYPLGASKTSLNFPGTPSTKVLKRHQLSTILTRAVFLFGTIHILVGLFLYYTSFPAFLAYVDEDGYVEYLTAFFLLMTSFYCLFKGFTTQRKVPTAFFSLMAILFDSLLPFLTKIPCVLKIL